MSKNDLLTWPNALSTLRIFLTPLFVLLLFTEVWYLKSMAFVVFVVAAVTDFFDGRLARSSDRITPLGRFLDPLADKILVTAALLAFVWGGRVHVWLVVPVIVRDVVITGLRLYSIYHGRELATSQLAKWKTATQLFAVVIILLCISLQGFLERFDWLRVVPLDDDAIQLLSNGLMGAVLLLTVLSGLHYLFRSNFTFNKS